MISDLLFQEIHLILQVLARTLLLRQEKTHLFPRSFHPPRQEKIYLLPRSHHLPRQERVFLSRSLHLCQVRIGVLESTFLFRDEPFQRYFLHLPGIPPDSSSSCKNPPPETGKDSLPPKMPIPAKRRKNPPSKKLPPPKRVKSVPAKTETDLALSNPKSDEDLLCPNFKCHAWVTLDYSVKYQLRLRHCQCV